VWADLEQGSAGKTERFGDAETGWKDRLIIPAPGSKREEPEPEEVSTKASVKDSKSKKEKEKKDLKPFEVKASTEAVTAAGVPADITPEEVAAIAAAAAAFEEKTQAPAEFSVKATEVPEEPTAVSATVQPDAIEAKPVEAKSKEIAAPDAPVVSAEAAKSTEPVAEAKTSEPAPVAKETTPEVPAAEVQTEPESSPVPASDAAVVAAIATIVEKPVEASEAALASAASVATVPKWVAQEVPLPPAETGINLEQEMQKTGAVLQAATAGDFSPKAIVEPLPAPPIGPDRSTPCTRRWSTMLRHFCAAWRNCAAAMPRGRREQSATPPR